MNANNYKRIGHPLYHIQVSSYGGGFLSTAAVTTNRAYVGDFALEQASLLTKWSEARQPYFSDAYLRVTDRNLVGIDGTNQSAVLSVYRWNPNDGTWMHSSGARIMALDA